MEITEQQQIELINLIKQLQTTLLVISKQNNQELSKEQVEQALIEYSIISKELATNEQPFIEQVQSLINGKFVSLKEFKAILSRISYQVSLGNVKRVKGYTLNAIAKETKQAMYR